MKLFKNKHGQEWWRTEMPLASNRAKKIGLGKIAELIRKQRRKNMETVTKVSWIDATSGESKEYRVGRNCNRILQHKPQGEGDKWYYDISLYGEDGQWIRVFACDSMEVELYTNEKS